MSDLFKPVDRRAVLGALGRMGALGLAVATMGINACGDGGEDTPTPTPGPDDSPTPGTGDCLEIPDETAGPYPDKTGMYDNQAYYRQDITEGRPGVPLSLVLTVVDVAKGCAAVPDAVVEIWHCDASGFYSEYAQNGYDGTGTTFLRGLQVADGNGQVKFNTIYPGWYPGRVTHIHVDVYVNGKVVKTTQLAFPDATSSQVYKVAPYSAHGQNSTSNSSDNIFSDGVEHEMLSITGNTTSGYLGALPLGI